MDGQWRGGLISHFSFHTYNWGMGANFINVDIKQDFINNPTIAKFIGGWRDVTNENGDRKILIWLRGSTTYYYRSNYAVTPLIYDGVSKPLPYQQTNGGTFTYKTGIDSYVNTTGMSYTNSAYFLGTTVNYFASPVCIGTLKPNGYKLAVEGTIGARRVKVDQETWADFVFEPEYKLPSLQDLEVYIKTNKHLPDVPSAVEVTKEGLDLGEMNKILLQKIEELTLHLIEENKRNKILEEKVKLIMAKLEKQESK